MPVIRGLIITLFVTMAGCSGASQDETAEAPPPESEREAAMLPPAPWAAEPLDADAVPEVYLQEWRQAANRSTCALLAPSSLGRSSQVDAASPRSAQFAGGWAVAYDLPDLRSAFGIAGTGTTTEGTIYDAWPHAVRWAGGSRAGYGPEGGSGPKQLAYLYVDGQECLYNVWSHLGREHLEYLLEHLRLVDVESAAAP